MCTFLPPLSSALRTHSTLGIMPPVIVPSPMAAIVSSAVMVEASWPRASITPGTSVRRMSFSAERAPATSAATVSPLMLYASPPARRDDGHEPVLFQHAKHARADLDDISHEPQVQRGGRPPRRGGSEILAGADQLPVLPRQTGRLPAEQCA